MSEIAVIALSVAGELLLFFFIGGLVPFAAKGEKKSFAETVCAGFLVTSAITAVSAFAAVRTGISLTLFAYILTAVLALLLSVSVVVNFSAIFRGTSFASGGFSFRLSVFLAFFFIAAVTALALLLPAPGDPGQVIAQMATDLHTDTLAKFVPGSGGEVLPMTLSGSLLRYSAFDTVLCRLTGLSPMTEMKLVRTAVVVIVSALFVWRIFCRLFEEHYLRAACATILALTAGVFFRTAYTPSGLLYSAPWTGNATLSAVLLPAVLLIALVFYAHPESRRTYVLLFLTGLASVSVSSVALLVWPAAMAALVLSVAVMTRRPKLLLAIPASSAVHVVIMLVYMNALTLPSF